MGNFDVKRLRRAAAMGTAVAITAFGGSIAGATTPGTAGGEPAGPPSAPLVVGGEPVCQTYFDTSAAANGEPDPAVLGPLIAKLTAEAPAEIAEPLSVMISFVGGPPPAGADTTGTGVGTAPPAGADTAGTGAGTAPSGEAPPEGEGDGPPPPEFFIAQSAVDTWMNDHCTFDTKLDVALSDYAFTGIPATVPTGNVGIHIVNEAVQVHELGLFMKAPGVTESFDEILALPDEEAFTKVIPIGFGFAPSNGSSGMVAANLAPGDYVALCFVPDGTMIENGGMTEGTGPPHFTKGMKTEFTVTG